VSYWIATGTHEGEWLGIPATGNKVEYPGVNIFRIACGKIVESWGVANHLGLLQQIGGLSTVATPEA
jgi:predicted ester cyclase